jgi:hypothetical protein
MNMRGIHFGGSREFSAPNVMTIRESEKYMAAAKNAGARVRVVSCVMNESLIQVSIMVSISAWEYTYIAKGIRICIQSGDITYDFHD